MTRQPRIAVGCVFLLVLAAARTDAGGPLLLRAAGAPFLWPNGGVNIPFNPDQGGLGPMNNAAAVAQTSAAFAAWALLPSASATHMNAGQLPIDVDETNFGPFLNPVAPDGLSAIVFDEDGAIFDLLFGPDSGVLGFAGPEWVNDATGEILEGVSFMNGGALLGADAFPIAEFLSVQVHEFGHYQNLAHTVVNGQAAQGAGIDQTGPTPNDTFPRPATFANRIETMYPFLFINGGQATPHADDIAIFSTLYPEPTFAATTGAINGLILAPNGTSRLTGVNVIARNIANPFDDAVSAISSDFTDDFTAGGPLVGTYTLRGLTPGASYAVFVDQILAGGFSTPPRSLPGPEEFYNGASESSDPAVDNPAVFTPIVAPLGGMVSGIDIIFNRLPPGPILAGDDTTHEIFPRFTVKVCGVEYESLFVNANGNVTFGAGSSDFSESIAEHLTGPPRIAGLWDDLNPSAGGTVSWSETSNAVTVTFSNVPEFMNTGANSFSITVRNAASAARNRYTLAYGAISATDGLAGYSCGGRITGGFEREQDISVRTSNPRQPTAVFEIFTSADNDLDNLTLNFNGTNGVSDDFEPNDSVAAGLPVKLPFNTEGSYTEISPTDDDVDFYRFQANAGDILAIETVPGLQAMDTVVGIFDAAGNLLLADDDSGVGTLSRLLVQVLVDGTYAVGVSTFPDFAFTGAGGDFGRYVLQINSYRGTILPVTDDGSVEVSLSTFTFPFQGSHRSSVFVNGNGNLTFGAANADFSESVAELLAGPPRIAPLWDDLSPTNFFTGAPQGLVIAEERERSLYVHFVSVPEFLTTGTNYFTVQMRDDGDVNIRWDATNRSDALIGVTQGGGAADPGPVDLRAVPSPSAVGTTYETFGGSFGTYGGVDLSYVTKTFRHP